MKSISVSDNLHRYIMDHKDADHKSAEAVIYGLIGEIDEYQKKAIIIGDGDIQEYDKVSVLYQNWIESIALNTRFENVYEHLLKHLDEDRTNWKAEDHRRWKLSLLNLFAIIKKQFECNKDIKEQCKIIYEKALEYQENYNDDGDYFENDYIESFKKLTNAQVSISNV